MIQMFRGVLDHEWYWVRIIQRIPHNVEPVRIPELRGFVPLVCGQPNRFAAHSSLDFDSANSSYRIPITCLRVCRRKASDIEADLQVPHTLAFTLTRCLVSEDN